MGDFRYPFNTRTPGVPDELTTALAANFRDAASRKYVETEAGLLIPKSILTAKGQLLGHDGSDPVAIPAAAGNGYVATSDNSQSGGVKWQPRWMQVLSERSGRNGVGIGTTAFGLLAQGPSYYTTAGSVNMAFYIDPADWSTNGVIVKLRAWCRTETAPTASNLDVALARVTAFGITGTISTISSVATVPSIPVTATANTNFSGVSPEATLTTAGWYLVNFVHNVNPAQAMSWGYTLMAKAAV